MLSRSDQIRFFVSDYLNEVLRNTPGMQHIVIPRYTESKSSDSPSGVNINVLSFQDETPFLGDRVGTLYSNYTFYRREQTVGTSVVDFRVLPTVLNASGSELSEAVFQLDFGEPEAPDADGMVRAPVTVSRLDYVFTTLTDSTTVFYDIPEPEVLPSSLLLYQGNFVFTRGVHWEFDTHSRRITFLDPPTDGSERITPRTDPEVNIVYLVKAEQRTETVVQGEESSSLLPYTGITIGRVVAGDVYNIRRSRTKSQAYHIYQGMGVYTMTATGYFQTKPDAEKMLNFLLTHLRQARVRFAQYGIMLSDIAGSLQTESEELDVSGDMSKGIELTWTTRCQYQFLWPVPCQLFEVLNFVFYSELDPGYTLQPAPLELFQFVERFQ